MNLNKNENSKVAAAQAAASLIKSNMKIGLGTGSTATYFIKELGKLVNQGLQIEAVATSRKSHELAESLSIPMIDINTITSLDLCVDGADQIDAKKQMIKGGGGALFREKIIATMSREMIVLVDPSKIVESLTPFKIPVEITPFAYKVTMHHLEALADSIILRKNKDNSPFITDNGNFIVDLHLKKSDLNLKEMNEKMHSITGVCETGLFLGLAGRVIIGYEDGNSEIR